MNFSITKGTLFVKERISVLYGKPMIQRYEQVEIFTEAEYARRQALIRKIMEEEDVDLLLVLGAPQDAFDQWLTGQRLLGEIIVPKNAEITGVFLSETNPALSLLPQSETPDFRRYLYRQPGPIQAHGVRFRDPMDAQSFAAFIGRYAPRTIGLVHPEALRFSLREALKEQLPSAEWKDITVAASLRKSVKSPEEIAAIAIANRIHERVMLAMPQVLRQGRTVFDIQNEITWMLHAMGSGNTLVHHWIIMPGDQTAESDPGPSKVKYPGYTLKAGDRVMVLLESNGPGGHHVAIARHFTLGPVHETYRKIVDVAARSQAFAASMLRPGENLRHIADETRAFIERCGYVTCDQNFMHGLGLTYFEPYSLNHYSESLPLPENAFLHAHPIVRTFLTDETGRKYRYESFVLDTFLVRPEGGLRTTSLPHDIPQIEP